MLNNFFILYKVNLFIKGLSLLINIVCYDMYNVLKIFIFSASEELIKINDVIKI